MCAREQVLYQASVALYSMPSPFSAGLVRDALTDFERAEVCPQLKRKVIRTCIPAYKVIQRRPLP